MNHGQGSEWDLAKKSENYVMPSSMRGVRGPLKELRRIRFLVAGLGVPPPENFWIRGLQMVHSNAFLGSFYPITHTPTP